MLWSRDFKLDLCVRNLPFAVLKMYLNWPSHNLLKKSFYACSETCLILAVKISAGPAALSMLKALYMHLHCNASVLGARGGTSEHTCPPTPTCTCQTRKCSASDATPQESPMAAFKYIEDRGLKSSYRGMPLEWPYCISGFDMWGLEQVSAYACKYPSLDVPV